MSYFLNATLIAIYKIIFVHIFNLIIQILKNLVIRMCLLWTLFTGLRLSYSYSYPNHSINNWLNLLGIYTLFYVQET